MSGFYICFRLSLHRGREWEREGTFCGRINKREIVSKWFLRCWCLVFSKSFVHDCKTAKCFQNQGEQSKWILIGQSFLKAMRTIGDRKSLLGRGRTLTRAEREDGQNHGRFWPARCVMG